MSGNDDASVRSLLGDSLIGEFERFDNDIMLSTPYVWGNGHEIENLETSNPPSEPPSGQILIGENIYLNNTNIPPIQDIKYLPCPIGPPNRQIIKGEYDFHIEINGAHTQRKKYLYSHKLHRIYVAMGTNFSINFHWSANALRRTMYVRATVVFADDDQAEKRVERCTQHSHEAANAQNIPMEQRMNVLWSARELGSPDVFYCGQPSQVNSWYSVVVLFPQPSSHAYKFVCKSSCPAGINRRALSIIFTLEDSNGVVYGRESVGVRVCSCTRRDMARDEQEQEGGSTKRKITTSAQALDQAKRVRVEVDRSDVSLVLSLDASVQLPPINVIGVRAAVTGLEVMVNMMEQARDQRQLAHQPAHDYDQAIAHIRTIVEQLKVPPENKP